MCISYHISTLKSTKRGFNLISLTVPVAGRISKSYAPLSGSVIEEKADQLAMSYGIQVAPEKSSILNNLRDIILQGPWKQNSEKTAAPLLSNSDGTQSGTALPWCNLQSLFGWIPKAKDQSREQWSSGSTQKPLQGLVLLQRVLYDTVWTSWGFKGFVNCWHLPNLALLFKSEECSTYWFNYGNAWKTQLSVRHRCSHTYATFGVVILLEY